MFVTATGILNSMDNAERWLKRIYISEAVSNIGSRISGVALMYLLYRQTGRAADMGIYVMLLTLPGILFSNPFGHVADKFNRKFLLVYADSTRAGILVCMALFIPSGNIMWLLSAYFLSQVFRTLYDTSVIPFASDLVKDENSLVKATANLRIIYHTSIVIGFGAGGFVAYYLRPQYVFLIDAGTFVFSACLLSTIPTEGRAPIPYFSVLREMFSLKYYTRWLHLVFHGFRMAWGHKYRKTIICLELVREFAYGLFNPLQSLWPQAIFTSVKNNLGLSAGMASIGSILGGVLTNRYTSKKINDGNYFFHLCLCFAVVEFVAFSVAYSTSNFWIFSSGLMFSSGCMSSFEIGTFAKYISTAKTDERGALSGFFQFITLSTIFAGSLVYTLIANHIPLLILPFLPMVFLAGSVLLLIVRKDSFE